MRRQLRVVYPLLVLATLLVGLCQASLGQGDADLEAPGLAPPATVVSGEATLFQGVRIFDGKSAALSPPSDVPKISAQGAKGAVSADGPHAELAQDRRGMPENLYRAAISVKK